MIRAALLACALAISCAHAQAAASAATESAASADTRLAAATETRSAAAVAFKAGALHLRGHFTPPPADGGAPSFDFSIDKEPDEVTATALGAADAGVEGAAAADAGGKADAGAQVGPPPPRGFGLWWLLLIAAGVAAAVTVMRVTPWGRLIEWGRRRGSERL